MNDHDNTPTTSLSEPPEDAYVQSTPSLLSPASPKPMHFPQPTKIPVLDNMMDVGWNQTEIHMNDPAMHNTEVRPDAWRDPNEQATDHDSPFSTGGEATQIDDPETAAHSEQTASNGLDDATASSVPFSNGNSHQANSRLQGDNAPPTSDAKPISASNPSDPAAASESAPTADASPLQTSEVENASQAQSTAIPTNAAPTDGLTAALSPSHAQSQAPVNVNDSSSQSAPSLGAAPAGLPPRPPPQENPLINQHYVHAQNLRDYHPHASHSAVQSHNRTNSSGHANAFTSPTQSHPNPGNAFQTQRSPLPGNASSVASHTSKQRSPGANTPIESRREYKLALGEPISTDDQAWDHETQRRYDHFLEEERRYVNEAQWDQFPAGSRLFVGNLSSEKVTKRDIYHVFHNYGDLAQVSIKQAYGFVQFLRPEDCARALSGEQGRQIRDKKIHLEVSKPQKAPRNQQNNNRRSRSPDQRNRNDRFQSGGRGGGGGGFNNRGGRDSRDGGGYRQQYRSPSPRGGYRDRRDDRYRTRSRSPPGGYNQRDRYTSRTSPPRRDDLDDDLPLPRRHPSDVPEVQLISVDALEKDFLNWVKDAFASRGVRVDTLIISPRLREDAVVRRQILEGVVAVSKLRRFNQDMSKIGLTIFKRRGGGQEVQFEEYDNLDPAVAVELVLREKAAAGPPPPPTTTTTARMGLGNAGGGYGYSQGGGPSPALQQQGYPPAGSYAGYPPQQPPSAYAQLPQSAGGFVPPGAYIQPQQSGYGQAPPYGAPPRPTPQNVNSNDLQGLLGILNPGSVPPQQQGGSPGGQYGYGGGAQQYPPPPQQQQQSGYAGGGQQGYGQAGPGAGMGMGGQQQGGGAPDMKDFLAKLQHFGERGR
ncbi:hypothetical protein TI39_contig414g00005 [Zymoseptoria brevis]|uniref:RRM domain-containing protein n=1 Tax=Zymoseptoria brevis TaxID=1047168 RepID=A0A0F4GLV7_9PEZI|nr:hypothetical protein TI39_contig414g00005 [Zymoseptoria brevis]